jgi:hypothetical protein
MAMLAKGEQRAKSKGTQLTFMMNSTCATTTRGKAAVNQKRIPMTSLHVKVSNIP